MTTNEAATQTGFCTALTASGRSREIPETADVYGWLIGSWELEIRHYSAVDVTAQEIKGEVHFCWTLEGRAVQDIWIMPRRSDRHESLSKTNNMYGITLRVWDPSIEAWRITWINPVTGHREEQIGRWSGKDIVQVGARSNGVPTRWMYTKITPDSFHWTGESLQPDAKTWKLEGKFRARRIR
jgi:hypothetical protein